MKLYRLLLSLYPARFREEYSRPLEQQFLDDYREAQTIGARAKLWLAALRDLAWSIPIELAHELKQDLSHSLHVHARRPFVMTFTVAILALAIGGATGVFSVVNAVLLKSLPFRDPDRLVVLRGFSGDTKTSAAFHEWRTTRPYLDDAVQVFIADMNVGGASVPTRISIAQTSFNFFSALGAEPFLGRAFAPTEDIPGNDAVAVIGYGLWQQLYAGDPRVLGSKLVLNGSPVTVIGVAPPGFDYPRKSSAWTPTAFDLGRFPNKGAAWDPFGRLKRGVSLAQARQMFDAEVAQLPKEPWMKGFPPPTLMLLKADLARNIRDATLILMAAVGFILLIACANVANLLLTRTSERRGELIIRAALGASRARLVQQLISESVFLSAVAAIAGLAVAYWASKLATLTQPAALGLQHYTILDWRVLGFAASLALATGLLFGVVPAWLVRQLQPSGGFGRTHGPTPRTARLRGILIAMQVALTLVLLAGSVTMGRSFLHLLDAGMGFPTEHVVAMSVALPGTPEQPEARRAAYYRDVLDRLRAVPGVESASAAYSLPLDDMFGVGTIRLENGRDSSPLLSNRVSPDYFRTMGMPLLYGREFNAQDTGRVAILSEGIAREVAEGTAVLGRKIVTWRDKEPYTVIGVVRATHVFSPDGEMREQYSLPIAQNPPDYATFLARVHGDAKDSLAACRDAVQSVDRDVPVFNAKTLEQRFDEKVIVPRFRTTILLFFGGFALLLAIAGIYGVSSYSITQRRREIGVRIAIGASAQGVRAMILRQALWPIAAGMLIGLAGAAWQGSVLEHLLPVPKIDMPACAAAAALLAAVAIISIWSATSRVLELNPIEVLKSD